jgi:excisionase family DNA binding protein
MKTFADKPAPSPTTRAAILALLRADPGVTAAHRARILAAFDATTTGKPPKGWLPASEVAKATGLHLSRLLRLIDAGKVAGRREGGRLVLVNMEEVAAYADANPPRRGRPPRKCP